MRLSRNMIYRPARQGEFEPVKIADATRITSESVQAADRMRQTEEGSMTGYHLGLSVVAVPTTPKVSSQMSSQQQLATGTTHKTPINPRHNRFMQLATWNVNSLNVRLPQVLDWLAANPVDALCLQELKLSDDKFPLQAFTDIGYHAAWAGQKTYNGVAILSREPGFALQRNIPGYEDPQQRVIAVTLPSPAGDVRVICAYCPNGQSLDSDKYTYKLEWFAALRDWLKEELQTYPRLAILGDYNVAPADIDVHNPEKWEGLVHVSEPERAAWRALLDLGLNDVFRDFEQPEKAFSWWDYRQFAFRRNAGLRIDHILLSQDLKQACTACVIDKGPRGNPQPSDHTPVIATLNWG